MWQNGVAMMEDNSHFSHTWTCQLFIWITLAALEYTEGTAARNTFIPHKSGSPTWMLRKRAQLKMHVADDSESEPVSKKSMAEDMQMTTYDRCRCLTRATDESLDAIQQARPTNNVCYKVGVGPVGCRNIAVAAKSHSCPTISPKWGRCPNGWELWQTIDSAFDISGWFCILPASRVLLQHK